MTSEKIADWKQSERGAPKIRAAVRDRGQKMPVRAEAVEALGELGLVKALGQDLRSLDGADRQQLLALLVPRLIKQMKGAVPGATTRLQTSAKDTLFTAREFVSGPVRDELDRELVAWMADDWSKRSSGENSGEKIVLAIGRLAAPILAQAVGRESAPLAEWSTLLKKVGDAQQREEGARQLLGRAKQARVPSAAFLQALGNLGSEKGSQYLLGLVRRPGELEPRLNALRALALSPPPSLVEPMQRLALDKGLQGDQAVLRDEAFTVLEKIDHPRSLEVLVGFLRTKEEMVRYRAAEAIIEGFREKGLRNLLEGLPPGYTYKRQDLEDFLKKDIVEKIGQRALPILRAELKSSSWIARVVAVMSLGSLGTKEDIEILQQVSAEQTRLAGLIGATNMGAEARAAIDMIGKRNQQTDTRQ